MSAKTNKLMTTLGILLGIAIAFYGIVWKWVICRVYVPPGYIMTINTKVGADNPDIENFRVVNEGIKGIQKKIYGEGRYFINPIVNDVKLTPIRRLNGLIDPLEIGIVESLSGKTPPKGEFLVAGEKELKGIIQAPITAGTWKLNPSAYKIKKFYNNKKTKAIVIEPGFVGCVTSLFGKNPPEWRLSHQGERGVMEKVLQPGIYYLNPAAYDVEKVEVGYRQILFPNINFKSKDGAEIEIDVSIVWGITPAKVPYIIDHLGNIGAVTDKIIRPQVESLCRIEGSKYGAIELIEGLSREKFQNTFTSKLISICANKDINVLLGLVRNIKVPQEMRAPMQKAKIAQEEKKTKKELQKTQKVINQLERLKREVEKAVREVHAETDRIVANIGAEGEKQVASIRAEQRVKVAEIKKQVADIEAQITRLMGNAKAKAQELRRRAEADELVQNVRAIGGPEEYTLYQFAKQLPEKMTIYIRHTGEGTLWTDLPDKLKTIEKMAAFKILKEKLKKQRRKKLLTFI